MSDLCPLTGEPVSENPRLYLMIDGEPIYFSIDGEFELLELCRIEDSDLEKYSYHGQTVCPMYGFPLTNKPNSIRLWVGETCVRFSEKGNLTLLVEMDMV